MQISLDLQPASKLNIKKQNANSKTSEHVAFRGVQEGNSQAYYAYTIDYAPILKGARSHFKQVLFKDGFSQQEVSKWRIFSHPELTEDFTFNELLKKYECLAPKTPTIERFPNPKDLFDIKAMEQVYNALSLCFNDEDMKHYSDIFSQATNTLKEKTDTKFDETKSLKDIILQILAYTNDNNKQIAFELISDSNFNNADVAQAIARIRTQKDAKAALEALDTARQIGYNKDFSLILAVMLSEANEENLPVIKKALSEQEFLTENKAFVTDKLFKFLRKTDYLTVSYVKDPSMTLKDIEEIIDSVKGFG